MTLLDAGPVTLSPCAGRLDLFYAAEPESADARAEREAKAKRVCFGCGDMPECRQRARDNREFGVWGGETETERAAAGFAPGTVARIRSIVAPQNKYRGGESVVLTAPQVRVLDILADGPARSGPKSSSRDRIVSEIAAVTLCELGYVERVPFMERVVPTYRWRITHDGRAVLAGLEPEGVFA